MGGAIPPLALYAVLAWGWGAIDSSCLMGHTGQTQRRSFRGYRTPVSLFTSWCLGCHLYNERSSIELDGAVRQVLAVVTATVRPQLPYLLQAVLFIVAI